MVSRFKRFFCTETGSKSNYLAEVFMWISESIIYADEIVELCATPSNGFKFLHDVEIDDRYTLRKCS